ncbi:MAG: thiolase family protein [Myxococcota bacterium]|nr:thiolase family protein [Myxococcota bacterium]
MDAYILESTRTAIGKRDGVLSHVRADVLAAENLKALVSRAEVEPSKVEDVVMGCVTQVGEQSMDVARLAILSAGFPISVPGTTVNRLCGSSLQAVNFAAQAVASGAMDVTIGGGVESMSRVPMGSDGGSFSDQVLDRFDIVPQGLSAELMVKKWGITRESLDSLSLDSHRRALTANEEGRFDREIHAVDGVDTDEGPRAGSTLEKLSTLRPAFSEDGSITAASSSQISDGAASLLIANAKGTADLGVKPRARFKAMHVMGSDPTLMLTGPIGATQGALARAGMTIDDIDVFEVNEAFAVVPLVWAAETGGDLEKTNVNGGAIALGHPLGCSGARLVTTLLHEMERQDANTGLATLCIGWGMAVATIIERV